MRRGRASRLLLGLIIAGAGLLIAYPALAKNKSKLPIMRWDEQNPGCTFSRSDDGLYRYGMWSGDVGIIVSIDPQELEKVHRRREPFFSALVNVRYRGTGALAVSAENISLEFVRHFHTIERPLDPDDFVQKIQQDADTVDRETKREVKKHPKREQKEEAYARTFQKEAAELQEFISTNSLRPARLDGGNPEANGWVLFATNSKWVSAWKKPEQFILRVPVADRLFEFPFSLPPKPGEVLLRKRE